MSTDKKKKNRRGRNEMSGAAQAAVAAHPYRTGYINVARYLV